MSSLKYLKDFMMRYIKISDKDHPLHGQMIYTFPDPHPNFVIEEKILCSAINYDGAIITGRRHKDCYNLLKSIDIDIDSIGREQQGFLTTFNRFVDRKEAWVIAFAQDQIKYGLESSFNGNDSFLISENIFDPEID